MAKRLLTNRELKLSVADLEGVRVVRMEPNYFNFMGKFMKN